MQIDRDRSTDQGTSDAVPITENDPNLETSLLDVVKSDAELDLLKELQGKYKDDPLFKSIIEKPKEFRNFEIKNDLLYLKTDGKSLLCIPRIITKGRSLQEIVISEAHSLLAHLGAAKTTNYLRDHVWWKDMVADTKAFCETCMTCKRSKPNNKKPYGLLNPLNIPSEPWESIGVDFVGPLPLSKNRDGEFDSITVVICLLTAMVEIIPSHTTYKAKDIAELMFENVYKHHGLPKTIVSDRDVLFTSTFWEHLNNLIGIKLKMSSAYHPQTDGATERANRTITQMLRQCINPKQKDWVSKLPTIQFAINSARSESTGYAPFFLNTGRMPRAMVWNSAPSTEYSNVREFALKRKLALISAHDSIIGARVKQTRNANRKRQSVPFKEGDFVYLSTKNITFEKGLARKLIPKFIGPYKIAKDFGNHSFKLELPTHLRRRGVHDVFHSSLLRIHLPNDDRLFPGRMDTQLGSSPGTEDEWAVEKMLSHAGSGEDTIFEIKWKSGDVTWLPYEQIKHLPAFEEYLDLLGVDNVSKLKAGTGNPPPDDPQVFLGALTPSYSPPTPSRQSLTTPLITYPQDNTTSPTHAGISSIKASIDKRNSSLNSSPIKASTCSSLLDNLFKPLISLNHNTMPTQFRHPLIYRRGKLEYVVKKPGTARNDLIHVGQVAKYLAFDRDLRHSKSIADIREVPMGYMDFAKAFNDGKSLDENCELSTIVVVNNEEHIIKSWVPLTLNHLGITAEQCGIPPRRQEDDSAAVFKDYATMKAKETQRRDEANQRRDEAIKARQERRFAPFDNKPAKRGKKQFRPRSRSFDTIRGSERSFASSPLNDYTFSKLPGPVKHIDLVPIDVIHAELQAAATEQVVAEEQGNFEGVEDEYMEVEEAEDELADEMGPEYEDQSGQYAQDVQYPQELEPVTEVPQVQQIPQVQEIVPQTQVVPQIKAIPKIKISLPIKK